MSHDTLIMLVTLSNAVFTSCRIVAHVPQLIAVVRDRCGAGAISVSSWVLFTFANASNGAYALVLADDVAMCLINLASGSLCAAVATVAAIKQRRFRRAGAVSGSLYAR